MHRHIFLYCASAVLAITNASSQVPAHLNPLLEEIERRSLEDSSDSNSPLLSDWDQKGGAYSILELIFAYQKLNQHDKALELAAAWKEAEPDNAEAWIVEARLHAQQGAYDLGTELLEEAHERFSDHSKVLETLIHFYYSHDQHGKIEQVYWGLYDGADTWREKRYYLREIAIAAENQETTPELIQVFEERHADHPEDAAPLLALAELVRGYNGQALLRQHLEKIKKLAVTDPGILHEVARYESRIGDYDTAVATLNDALGLGNQDSTHLQLARVHFRAGDNEAAKQILSGLQPETAIDSITALEIADAMVANCNWEELINFLRPIITEQPGDFRLKYWYGVALEESWRTEEAAEVFLSLLKLYQKSQALEIPYGFYHDRATVSPDGIDAIDRYTNWSHEAYRRSYHPGDPATYGWYASTRDTENPTPHSIDFLNGWVLTHLRTVASNLDPAAINVTQRLEELGIPYPLLVLQNNFKQLHAAYEAYADEAAVQADLILSHELSDYATAPRAKELFALFQAEHPELAVSTAFQAYLAYGEEVEDIFAQALSMLDRVQLPREIVYPLIAILDASTKDTGVLLSSDQREQILSLMGNWKFPQTEDYLERSVFQSLLAALRHHDDLSDFVLALEKETKQFEPIVTHTTLSKVFPLRLLSLKEATPQISPRTHTYLEPIDEDGRSLNLAKLRNQIEKAENPVLRATLAFVSMDYRQCESLISELLATEDPPLDAYLLGALVAIELNEASKASDRLVAARAHDSHESINRIIDSSIVFLSLQSPEVESITNAGGEAARRLATQQLTDYQRNELAHAFDALGLSEDAVTLRSVTDIAVDVETQAPESKHIIERLIENGETDRAITKIVQTLRTYASFHLEENEFDSHRQRPTYTVSNIVESHALLTQVLEAALPGDAKRPGQLAQYAMVCEILGDLERASEFYLQALASDPDLIQVRKRLFLIQLKANSVLAADHLLHFNNDELGQMSKFIVNASKRGFEDRNAVLEILISFLESAQNTDSLDLSWCIPIAQEAGSFSLQSAVQAGGNSDPAFGRLCAAMIKVPQLARVAFSLDTAHALFSGAGPNVFANMAGEALLIDRPYRNRPNRINTLYPNTLSSRTYASATENIPFVDPEEYLVAEAWRNDTIPYLNETIIPFIRESSQTAIADSLEQRVAFYQCPEDDFLQQATDYLQAEQPINIYRVDPLLSPIIDAWDARDLTLDLTDILKPFFFDDRFEFADRPWFLRYQNRINVIGDGEVISNLLELIAQRYLGSPENRVAFVEAHFVPGQNWGYDPAQKRAETYVNILRDLATGESFIFPVLEQHAANGLLTEDDHRIFLRTHQMTHEPTADSLVRVIKSSPYLNGIADFRLYPIPETQDHPHGTMFTRLMSFFSRNEAGKAQAQEFLATIDPPTFGSGLLQVYLDDPQRHLADYLARYGSELRNLPPDHRAEFLSLTSEVYPQQKALSGMSEAGSRLIEELRLLPDPRIESEILEYTEGTYNNLKSYGPNDHPARLIRYLLDRRDMNRAVSVFSKYVEIIDQFSLRTMDPYPNSQAGLMLGTLFTHRNHDPHSLALSLDILSRRHGDREVEDSTKTPASLLYALHQNFKDGSTSDDAVVRFKEFYRVIQGAIEERPCSIISADLSQLFSEMSNQEIDETIEWLKADSEPTSLTIETIVAAKLKKHVQGHPLLSIDSLAEIEAHNLAVIEDDSLPITWRLSTVASLLQILGSVTSPEVLLQSAELLAENWNSADSHFSDEQGLAIALPYLAVIKESDLPQTTSEKLIQGWLASLNRVPNRPLNEFEIDLTMACLELALIIGDEAVAKSIIDSTHGHNSKVGRTGEGLLLLIHHKAFDIAADMVRQDWSMMQSDYGHSHYTANIDTNLDEFLNRFQQADLRYFCELMIKTAPDSNEEGVAILARSQRMNELAQRFGNISFTDGKLEEYCLYLLAQEVSSAEVLHERYAEYADAANYVQIMESAQAFEARSRQVALIAAYMTYTASQGDPAPFLNHLDQILEAAAGASYYARRDPLKIMSEAFVLGMKQTWAEWNNEDFDKFVPVLDRIFSMPEDLAQTLQYTEWATYSDLAVATLILGGGMEGLEEWHDTLTEFAQQRFKRHITFDGVMDLLSSAGYHQRNGVPEMERLRQLNEISTHSIFSWSFESAPNVFTQWVEHGFLSESIIIRNASDLIRFLPRQGYAAAEVAMILTDSDAIDRAVDYWEQAIEASPADPNAHYRIFHEGLAETLHRADRLADAVFILEGLDRSRLSLSDRGAYENQILSLLAECEQVGLARDSITLAVNSLNDNANHLSAWRALASLYDREGDRLRAEENLETASTYYRLAVTIGGHINGQGMYSLENETASRSEKLIEIEYALGRLRKPKSLINRQTTWRYFDQGEDLGVEWRDVDYDDQLWERGPAKLGYGDSSATEVSFGDNPDAKHITTYFRRQIEIIPEDLPMAKLNVSLLRDDGAIVYINGNEVIRDRMPEGVITYDTLANSPVDGPREQEYFSFEVSPEFLRPGVNVVAVEIHQVSRQSSDIGFDLEISGVFVDSDSIPASPNLEASIQQLNPPVPQKLQEWLKVAP